MTIHDSRTLKAIIDIPQLQPAQNSLQNIFSLKISLNISAVNLSALSPSLKVYFIRSR